MALLPRLHLREPNEYDTTKPFGFYLPLLKTCLKWKFLCSRDVGKCRGGSVRLYEKILFLTVGESVYYLIVKCP